jgi:hypothetical protein
MRAYHGLTPEQINILIMPYKARIFAHHFITTRSLEETKVFEDIVQRRLMGTISNKEMFEALHRSANDGGVGFDIRTAEKIIARIDQALKMSYYASQTHHQKKNAQGEHESLTADEKAELLIPHLFEVCYREHAKNLKPEQRIRLHKAIKDRIDNTIQKIEFYNALDLSFKDGGVGLNSKTAKAITEETELILILSFGIVKVDPRDIKILDDVIDKTAVNTNASQVGATAALEILKKIKDQQSKGPGDIAADKAKQDQETQIENESEDLSLQEAVEIAQQREEEIKSGKKNDEIKPIKF